MPVTLDLGCHRVLYQVSRNSGGALDLFASDRPVLPTAVATFSSALVAMPNSQCLVWHTRLCSKWQQQCATTAPRLVQTSARC